MRCLAKSPDDRFPAAAELAQALDECVAAGRWSHELAADWWRDIGHALPRRPGEVVRNA